jgi:hypothetical protein
MKKLEDISKNHPFKVPEDYFDQLPGVIQSRVAEKSNVKEVKPYFRYALQYALPVVVLVVVAIIYLIPTNPKSVDSLLASVTTEELVAYLEQSEITTEELLESMDLNIENVEAIESEVYSNLDELENLHELELELNNL